MVSSHQRQHRRRVPRGRAPAAAALAVALVLLGCGGSDEPGANGGAPAPSASEQAAPPTPRELVVVLPPIGSLDELEQARVRAGVARAVDEVLGASRPFRIVSAPTLSSLGDVVEQAARGADVVCVLGPQARASLEAALVLYPQTVACALPSPDDDGSAVLGTDIDLEALGLQLGRTARAAAGAREVLVLAGGDPLHGVGWVAGVRAGAAGGPVRVLGAVDDLRDELAQAIGGQGDDDPGPGPPSSRGRVGVVVLDASPGAAQLARELLEAGVLVIAPRAFVVDAPDVASLVLRWRVRWDLPLAGLLRRAIAAADGTPPAVVPGPGPSDGPFVLEEGPAHVPPGTDPVG
jgi:hypothetical protein